MSLKCNLSDHDSFCYTHKSFGCAILETQELNGFFDRLDASLPSRGQPEPPAAKPQTLDALLEEICKQKAPLPARALTRFPTHPSDVLKLLSDI